MIKNEDDRPSHSAISKGEFQIQLGQEMRVYENKYIFSDKDLAQLSTLRRDSQNGELDQETMKYYSSIQQKHMNFDEMVKQSKNRVELIRGK